MRRRLGNLLAMLGSLVLSVAVAECALRIQRTGSILGLSGEHSLRKPHPQRGWTLDAGRAAYQRTKDYAVTVRTNAKGLRDRPHDYEPAPGTHRIVVLGDSFMEAYQVPLEASLPYRLQERLAARNAEVINLGIGGYGTAQQLLYLREEGLRYRPDHVLLAFFTGNDIQNNSAALQELLVGADEAEYYARPYAQAPDLTGEITWAFPDPERMRRVEEKWRRRSALGRRILRFLQPSVVANVIEQATASIAQRFAGRLQFDPNTRFGWPFLGEFAPAYAAPGLTRERYDAIWEEAWRVTRRLVLEVQREAAAHGAEFTLMTVPAIFQVDRVQFERIAGHYPELVFEPTRINRELARFAEEHAIDLLDLNPVFVALHSRENRPLFHEIEDRHWNAEGHAVATEALAEHLEQRVWGRR